MSLNQGSDQGLASSAAVFSAAELRQFTARVLESCGATPGHAALVAESLVTSNLLGHDSHGIIRLPSYCARIQRGELDPVAEPTLLRENGGTAVIDGGNTFGQVVGRYGCEVAVRLAKAHGISAVVLHRTTHVGRLGEYAEVIAGSGCIALLFASGADRGGAVAPYGGRQRRLGSNPVAWAVPVPAGHPPLIGDFATAAIAVGKVAVAKASGGQVPDNTVIAADGSPSTDPNAYFAGGALLPFGGHKGGSLMILIEILAAILGGNAPASSREFKPGNPTLLIALRVDHLMAEGIFLRQVAELGDNIASCPPAAGFDRVRLPHALELETAARRSRDGIALPDSLVGDLQRLATSLSVAPPQAKLLGS